MRVFNTLFGSIPTAPTNLLHFTAFVFGFDTNCQQNEDSLEHADNPTAKKEVEQVIAQFKARQQILANIEQEAQARLSESEQQLRVEQAKLATLQEQLDRLEKALESSK